MATAARIAMIGALMTQDITSARDKAETALRSATTDPWWDQLRELQALAIELHARTVGDWPGFAEELEVARRSLFDAMQTPNPSTNQRAAQIVLRVMTVSMAAGGWLGEPEHWETPKRRLRDRLLRRSPRPSPAKLAKANAEAASPSRAGTPPGRP